MRRSRALGWTVAGRAGCSVHGGRMVWVCGETCVLSVATNGLMGVRRSVRARDRIFSCQGRMNRLGAAAPLHGAATRTLPQSATLACRNVPPMVTASHVPPVPCCVPRPVNPHDLNSVAVARQATASVMTVPTVVRPPPASMRHLSAGTRPKTLWGVIGW